MRHEALIARILGAGLLSKSTICCSSSHFSKKALPSELVINFF
jgi:hypothetical protein